MSEISRLSIGHFLRGAVFTTFCHQKVVPKVSARRKAAGNSQRLAKTGACRGLRHEVSFRLWRLGKVRKRPLHSPAARRFAHPLRALEPPSDLFPPPVQCGDYCALRATVIICLRPHVAGLWSSDAMGACLPDQVKTHPLFRIGCAERGAILPVRVPEVVKTIYFLKKRARLFFNSQNYSIFALDFAE